MSRNTWLTVIGIGEDGADGLSSEAKGALSSAEILVGGERHLAMISQADAPAARERHFWPVPFLSVLDRLEDWKGRRTCVVATGDPLLFGAGETFVKNLPREDVTVIPHISAFSLAAARLGWSLASAETVTLHGRPVSGLAPHIYPGARILILSADRNTPAAVAEYLAGAGIEGLAFAVLAHMGGPREERFSFAMSDIPEDIPDFHTLALEIPAAVPFLSAVPGLPDDAFGHDGKMTKREVRAAALSKLMPHAGAVLWDVGAGCGSIAIEWLRAAPRTKVFALEPNESRRDLMAKNAEKLAPAGLTISPAKAPEGFTGLPAPDAVFAGGGVTMDVIDTAFKKLNPGGRLVAHAVTLESETVLLSQLETRGGELTRIAVSRAAPVGSFHGWKPLMPVTQWSIRKQ